MVQLSGKYECKWKEDDYLCKNQILNLGADNTSKFIWNWAAQELWKALECLFGHLGGDTSPVQRDILLVVTLV